MPNAANAATARTAETWRAGLELTELAIEAQTVIGFRMLGIAGVWATHPTEAVRMITEKQSAFADAAFGAANAAIRGEAPAEVLRAAMRPLRRTTGNNVRRLSRRGFRTR